MIERTETTPEGDLILVDTWHCSTCKAQYTLKQHVGRGRRLPMGGMAEMKRLQAIKHRHECRAIKEGRV